MGLYAQGKVLIVLISLRPKTFQLNTGINYSFLDIGDPEDQGKKTTICFAIVDLTSGQDK